MKIYSGKLVCEWVLDFSFFTISCLHHSFSFLIIITVFHNVKPCNLKKIISKFYCLFFAGKMFGYFNYWRKIFWKIIEADFLDYMRQWPAYSFSNIMRSLKYIRGPIVNFREIPSALKDPLEEIFKKTETPGKRIIYRIVAIGYYRINVFSDALKNCSFSRKVLQRGWENYKKSQSRSLLEFYVHTPVRIKIEIAQ